MNRMNLFEATLNKGMHSINPCLKAVRDWCGSGAERGCTLWFPVLRVPPPLLGDV